MPKKSKKSASPSLRRALEKLSYAVLDLVRQGQPAPIVVGGAAVSLATGESISTGDIDLVCSNDEALADALRAAGFRAEDRAGCHAHGFYDPETAIGVETVGSRLFDGRADERRCVAIAGLGGGVLRIAAIEDLVVDRAAQFDSGTAPEMLMQVRLLLESNPDVDVAYLDRRLGEETSDRLTLRKLKSLIRNRRAL